MIKVEQLTKKYPGVVAIQDLSFEVDKGEIVGFLGPNGAGKSTTMRILSSFMPATSGRAYIAGHDVFRDSLKARRHLGYLPESVPLYGDMRVNEYLRYRGSLKGLSGRKLRSRADAVKELCSVKEVENKLIASLSKGYRQRVGLAEALIHEPDLLILDEPTIGLDPESDSPCSRANQILRQTPHHSALDSYLVGGRGHLFAGDHYPPGKNRSLRYA